MTNDLGKITVILASQQVAELMTKHSLTMIVIDPRRKRPLDLEIRIHDTD